MAPGQHGDSDKIGLCGAYMWLFDRACPLGNGEEQPACGLERQWDLGIRIMTHLRATSEAHQGGADTLATLDEGVARAVLQRGHTGRVTSLPTLITALQPPHWSLRRGMALTCQKRHYVEHLVQARGSRNIKNKLNSMFT